MTFVAKRTGAGGISGKIIADSISPQGVRLTTFELEYPRFIHAELMTHRMFSKNAASSRAIPVKASLELIESNPAMPVFWGKNQSGMQAKEELVGLDKTAAIQAWLDARDSAVKYARLLETIKSHKQITNRITEPWAMIKVILTGTEYNNLWHLRDHPLAQPEFGELGSIMHHLYDVSVPELLQAGEWHLPYCTRSFGSYYVGDEEVDLPTAKIVSTSCCAQVSYRKNDDSIEKAYDVYSKLGLDQDEDPKHASPTEHQATPMAPMHHANMLRWYKPSRNIPEDSFTWEPGITHARRDGSLWSGNLRGWIQHRQLISNEAMWG